MNRLIRFSVNHPVTICMMMLALLMGGAFSFSRMEVELLPSISIPTLLVTTEYPKTSPEKVHQDLTLPLEGILNGTDRLASLNSVSLEGKSQLVLELDWGCDIRTAEIQVREKINTLVLPDGAEKPLITKVDPSSAPVFRFDIYSETQTTSELRGVAEKYIQPRLERLSGVGEVEVLGGTEAEFRVVGSRDKLAQYQLTILNLVQAIRQESQNRKGGTIEIEEGRQSSLRILGKAANVADLENLIVGTTPDGRVIRVSEVAAVIRTQKAEQSYARINGQPSVGLSIRKASDASVVTVVQKIQRELQSLTPTLEQQGIQYQLSQDDSEYVLNAQNLVYGSTIQGIAFAGMLLFLFLRDLRVTLIVALTTPVSIMAGAIFLNLFGISRNVQTLGGLGLAAGMTLDSSIVLIESIYKQLNQGLKPKEAAIRGASEVATGIFVSALTTVAVFLPVLLIPGLMQEMFKSLAHAVIWSMTMSMVVGILFIPMVAARILSPQVDDAGNKSPALWRAFIQRMNGFDRYSENLLSWVLGVLMRSKFRMAVVVMGLISVSVFSLVFLPGKGFLPQGKVNEVWVRFEAPQGATLDYVDGKLAEVESLLKTEPYRRFVKSVSADVKSSEGRLFVRLLPNKKTRNRDQQGRTIPGYEPMRPMEWNSLPTCVQQIRQGCDTIPDLPGSCFVTVVDKVKGGTRAPIIFKVFSKEVATGVGEAEQLVSLRKQTEDQLLPQLDEVSGAVYQRVRLYKTPKEMVISTEANREVMVEKGIATEQISDTIRASVYGVKAATIFEAGNETDVTVQLEDSQGDSAGNYDRQFIETLRVQSVATGQLHEVGEISQVNEVPQEGSIVFERTDRKPTVNLESHYDSYELSRKSVDQVTDEIEKAVQSVEGFEDRYGYQIKSEAKDTHDSFADANWALIISLLLVYMIMCSQFENLLNPLAIMITVPLATAGSVFCLNAMGEIFSLAAYTGAIVLAGVVVNNGIITIEYINILRKRGLQRDRAVVEGSVRKLKSILITTLTSVFGMLPLILGIGEGTELYRGVAAVVVGGLVVSTPLTLLALPLLYSLLDELVEYLASIGFRITLLKERIFST